MAINLNDNIAVLGAKPTDARYLDNLLPYASVGAAESAIAANKRYTGLTVNVGGDEYWFKDGIINGDLVQKSLGGTSNLSGATNGLSLFSGGTHIGLGGGLIDVTNITISGTTSLIFTDTRATKTGIEYGGDYETDFVARSLVTAQYVTGYTQSASNTLSVCNVNATYTATTLNDFIGVSGATCIFLPAVPKACQRITVADIEGDALTNSIEVNGNGICINGASLATINTDYGSMTFINNNVSGWSAVAFIN